VKIFFDNHATGFILLILLHLFPEPFSPFLQKTYAPIADLWRNKLPLAPVQNRTCPNFYLPHAGFDTNAILS